MRWRRDRCNPSPIPSPNSNPIQPEPYPEPEAPPQPNEVAALWHGGALEQPPTTDREHAHPSDGYTEAGEYKPMLCGPLSPL